LSYAFRFALREIVLGYFDSIYVRTPAGAPFEATVSKPEGFLIDERYEELGG
jgi:glyoxalase family protein